MPRNPLKLKIAYLYPDILQGFCDKANIDAFVFRASLRDIEVTVNEININDKIQSSKYDFYYIGGTNTDKLDYALYFLKRSANELHVASIAWVPMLAVGCGYLLFSSSYQMHNKTEINAISLLDVDAKAQKTQYIGNIAGFCSFLEDKTIAGFENHTMAFYLNSQSEPFITVKKGFGNNAKDKTEGARSFNCIGTNIISPILAQNPHFCDYLISLALKVKYKCQIPLMSVCDDIEWFSHNYILDHI